MSDGVVVYAGYICEYSVFCLDVDVVWVIGVVFYDCAGFDDW